MSEVRQTYKASPRQFGLVTKGEPSPLRAALAESYRTDEAKCVQQLLQEATLDEAVAARIQQRACELVTAMRARRRSTGGIEAFLHEYAREQLYINLSLYFQRQQCWHFPVTFPK